MVIGTGVRGDRVEVVKDIVIGDTEEERKGKVTKAKTETECVENAKNVAAAETDTQKEPRAEEAVTETAPGQTIEIVPKMGYLMQQTTNLFLYDQSV